MTAPRRTAPGRYAGLRERRPAAAAALAGIPLGLAGGAAVLGLGTHFAGTRNWGGLAVVTGLFLAAMTAMAAARGAGDKRGALAGLRRAAGFLGVVAFTGAVLGPWAWTASRHWGGAAQYAAMLAWAGLIAGACLLFARFRPRARRYRRVTREYQQAGARSLAGQRGQ